MLPKRLTIFSYVDVVARLNIYSLFLLMNFACAATASLIRFVVAVLPVTLGTIIGPRPPLPALTTTGLLDAVPKPPVFF